MTAVLLAPFALLAAWFLSGVHRRRPWDAMLFAASPALVLTGLVNWDLLAVAAVAGALWAWSRDRPVLAGVLIGLGTAIKLYPLFLLGALLVVCLRRGRMPRVRARPPVAAVLAWLAVNLPAMLTAFDQWKVFWTFNDERGADLGSVWLVWQQMGHTVTPGLVNAVSLVFFGAVCVGVLVLGLRARRTPRIPQLAFLVVVGFLLVNKVYSPQYVLWLLPLVALARPRWRDVLIWTAGEVFYFGSVWLYLGGWTASGVERPAGPVLLAGDRGPGGRGALHRRAGGPRRPAARARPGPRRRPHRRPRRAHRARPRPAAVAGARHRVVELVEATPGVRRRHARTHHDPAEARLARGRRRPRPGAGGRRAAGRRPRPRRVRHRPGDRRGRLRLGAAGAGAAGHRPRVVRPGPRGAVGVRLRRG